MFIRKKKRKNGKISVQIVESQRRGDKVSQVILRHVGQAENEQEADIMEILAQSILKKIEEERQPSLPLFEPEEIITPESEKGEIDSSVELKNLREEQRINVGFPDVFGKLYNELGFDKLIQNTRKDQQWNKILRSCVIARLANPSSKKRTSELLGRDFGVRLSLEKIYRMMDHLAEQEDDVKDHIMGTTLALFREKVEVLFFDVTTLYFESFEPDDLRKSGFSKDNKFKETQIMLALITTTKGLPIGYKIYHGKTFEGHTLLDMMIDLKTKYDVKDVTVVADRAMFTQKNFDGMDDINIQYIVAAKLKSMSNSLKKKILSSSYNETVVNGKTSWTKEFEYKSHRLIVSYSSDRAKKDATDRQRLIDRIMKKAKDGKIKVTDLITNQGNKKFLEIKGGEVTINEAKIAESAKWDGLHGVITSNCDEDSSKILERYRGLWQIEEAFRVSKHDLRMRPIYHWTEPRIRAHIAICFIAYTLVKQILYRLSIQKGLDLSFERIRDELAHIQASVLVDLTTKEKYILPSKATSTQKKIYKALGMNLTDTPYRLIK
jgi:transposase